MPSDGRSYTWANLLCELQATLDYKNGEHSVTLMLRSSPQHRCQVCSATGVELCVHVNMRASQATLPEARVCEVVLH